MAEEKDTNFKITDRRKFNADGTPREQSGEPLAPEPQQAEAQQSEPLQAEVQQAEVSNQPPGEAGDESTAEIARDNVVSFPGDSAKKKEQAEPQPSPDKTDTAGQAEAVQNDAASGRSAQAKAAASAAEQAYNQTKRVGGPQQMPEASFLALVDMLAGEAAMCLGLVKHPTGAEMPVDLDTARHLIDMVSMLQQKTKGNLTAEENDVLENILAYLRMQFVTLSRRA